MFPLLLQCEVSIVCVSTLWIVTFKRKYTYKYTKYSNAKRVKITELRFREDILRY